MTTREPLESRLEHLFAFPIPESAAQQMRVRVASISAPRRATVHGRIPWPRPVRVGLLVAVGTLLVAAASVASLTLLERIAYHAPPGYRLAYDRATKLGIDIKTSDGIVRLDRAYADANRVVLALVGPKPGALGVITLTDATGRTYIELGGPGGTELSGVTGYLAAWIAPNPVAPGPMMFTARGGDRSAPWSASFTLEVAGGATVEPNLSATANGITLTVRRFTVSPTGVVVELANSPLSADWSWAAANWSLQRDGQGIGPGAGRIETTADDQRTRTLLLDQGTDETVGSWQLVIREMVGDNADGQTRVSGPWVFNLAIH